MEKLIPLLAAVYLEVTARSANLAAYDAYCTHHGTGWGFAGWLSAKGVSPANCLKCLKNARRLRLRGCASIPLRQGE